MKLYKLPSFDKAIQLAVSYSNKSIEFTYDYSGWEHEGGTERKRKRIEVGRFGQEWFCSYLRLNGIACHSDDTSPEQNDKYDVMVMNKLLIDIKTSSHPGFIGQVSPGVFGKNGLFAYCFLLTDKEYSFVEPLGFAKPEDKDLFYFIDHGQPIRDTGFTNNFNKGSYFIDQEKMIPFFVFINFLVKGLYS